MSCCQLPLVHCSFFNVLINFSLFYLFLGSSKVDIPKESSADHNIKSEQINGIDKNKVCNGSVDVKLEYGQLANGQNGAIIENSLNESNNIVAKTNCVKELENPKENGLIETKENGTDKSDTGAINDEPTKPQRIDDSVIMELKSKKDIRQKVWEFLEENSLVVFPKPCFNRIPNFKGCIDATQTLEKLDDFKKAKTVQVTPDKAQETARFLTLNVSFCMYRSFIKLNNNVFNTIKFSGVKDYWFLCCV